VHAALRDLRDMLRSPFVLHGATHACYVFFVPLTRCPRLSGQSPCRGHPPEVSRAPSEPSTSSAIRPCMRSACEPHAALRNLATCSDPFERHGAKHFVRHSARTCSLCACPIPRAPLVSFVRHSALSLCMPALQYSVQGVCLCAEIF
jgi:hypothetical protein